MKWSVREELIGWVLRGTSGKLRMDIALDPFSPTRIEDAKRRIREAFTRLSPEPTEPE